MADVRRAPACRESGGPRRTRGPLLAHHRREADRPGPRQRPGDQRHAGAAPSTRARSTASITTSARRRCRTCLVHALRQQHLRAAVEPEVHRPRADHRGRGGGRAARAPDYYEEAGALRDMVQNHILQVLCLTAMEPPWSLDADVVRDASWRAAAACGRCAAHDVDQLRGPRPSTRCPGSHRGVDVARLPQRAGVQPDSTTETYVALQVFVDNWRWAGVPFYLRTGKRLPKRGQRGRHPVQGRAADPLQPRCRRRRWSRTCCRCAIQPEEGLSLRIASKLPGPKVRIYPVKMDFSYGSTFGEQRPRGLRAACCST